MQYQAAPCGLHVVQEPIWILAATCTFVLFKHSSSSWQVVLLQALYFSSGASHVFVPVTEPTSFSTTAEKNASRNRCCNSDYQPLGAPSQSRRQPEGGNSNSSIVCCTEDNYYTVRWTTVTEQATARKRTTQPLPPACKACNIINVALEWRRRDAHRWNWGTMTMGNHEADGTPEVEHAVTRRAAFYKRIDIVPLVSAAPNTRDHGSSSLQMRAATLRHRNP